MNEIRDELMSLADPKYREFSSKLLPGQDNVIGVKNPKLRDIAKRIAKGEFRTYLDLDEDIYHEESMLRAMVIGSAKMPLEERMKYISGFVPGIANWAVCDTFCAGISDVGKNKARYWDFITPYFDSDNEYEVRFAVAMALDHFISGEYIKEVLERLDNISHNGYYVKMAVAWAVSVCYIKFPEDTLGYLKNCKLDDFTYNKALSKIIESLRVSNAEKDMMRKMKRKKVK